MAVALKATKALRNKMKVELTHTDTALCTLLSGGPTLTILHRKHTDLQKAHEAHKSALYGMIELLKDDNDIEGANTEFFTVYNKIPE